MHNIHKSDENGIMSKNLHKMYIKRIFISIIIIIYKVVFFCTVCVQRWWLLLCIIFIYLKYEKKKIFEFMNFKMCAK